VEQVSGQQLAEWAAEARERWSVPGLAVGLLHEGETVVAADGVCELGSDERVLPETAFRIASITKPFTATLALALAQDRLLALDEPVLERLGLESTGAPDFALEPEQLAGFGGTYSGDGIEVEVVPENGRLSVAVTFFDPLSGENVAYPPFLARPVDEREFEVVDADRRGERLTFPRDGFVCIGVLAARTE
jgi:hypothetical protein